jgi:hypothetical protein
VFGTVGHWAVGLVRKADFDTRLQDPDEVGMLDIKGAAVTEMKAERLEGLLINERLDFAHSHVDEILT